MINLKQFELAEILNKMTREDTEDVNYLARQTKLNTQFAYHEFINKKFEQAMDRFLKTDVEVLILYYLF